MKKILVGIDFTPSSKKALNYAATLAQKSGASLLLFHVFESPILHSNSGLYFFNYKQIKEDNQSKLEKFAAPVQKSFPEVHISCVASPESFNNEISDMADKKKIQLVVLGMETKSKMSKFIYGSHATDIAGKIDCPVIIVPEKSTSLAPSHALLAYDNAEVANHKGLSQLKKFLESTTAHLRVVHFKTPDEVILQKKQPVFKLDKKTELPVEMIETKDFMEGLKKEVKKSKADLVVVISRSHSMIYNFFNESHTKLVAFNTNVPVLAIHD